MIFFLTALHNEILVIYIVTLILLPWVLTYVVVDREASLLVQKDIKIQHIPAQALFADLHMSILEGWLMDVLVLLKRLRGTLACCR
jgi:hypothetical protein